jgi:hypothetical protein
MTITVQIPHHLTFLFYPISDKRQEFHFYLLYGEGSGQGRQKRLQKARNYRGANPFPSENSPRAFDKPRPAGASRPILAAGV